MNELTIEIRGPGFAKIGAQMMASIDDVVATSAEAILTDAKLSIANPPKTGRTYRHGKVTHQASAQGEPPAWDTGNLANASQVRRVGAADYQVVFSARYARALEFGYPVRALAARPFLRPAVARERPRLITVVRNMMRRGR